MNRYLVVTLILCLVLAGCAPATATPEPPATPGATAAVALGRATSATPTATPSAKAVPSTAAPSATPPPAAMSPIVVRGPAWAAPGVDTAIAIHTRAYEYTPSGRPAGMDDPTRGCTPFDESRRVTLLTVTLRIHNHSGEAMRDWYASFTTPDGQPLYTCHQGLEHMPDLPSGHYVDVTFGAFMEGGPVQVRGCVVDAALGRSNEVVL